MKTAARKRIMGALLIAALLIIGGRTNHLGWLRQIVGGISSPFVHAFSGVGNGLRGTITLVATAKDLTKKNSQLEAQIAGLHQQLASTADIRAENEALKRQLNVADSTASNVQLIPAEVIAYQPDNFRAFATISRGSRDGVVAGLPVISEGSLVGVVSDVTASTAKVFLLIDPDFKVTGYIRGADESKATGTVSGQLGRGLIMEKIPQDQTIKAGNTVLSSGNGGIAKGYVIGQVQSIAKQDNGVFQTAQITSAINFNSLETVFVVVTK